MVCPPLLGVRFGAPPFSLGEVVSKNYIKKHGRPVVVVMSIEEYAPPKTLANARVQPKMTVRIKGTKNE